MEVSNKVDITYKRLTEKELDTFIQMRINQLREEGATEEIDLVPNLEDYYKRHMADGTFVSWIAMELFLPPIAVIVKTAPKTQCPLFSLL